MQADYINRINKVLSFIEDNLSSDLSLSIVASEAYYSPFHLHRIFKAVTNETLNTYITRKRIERAAIKLIHNSDLTITEIATEFGFKSDSVFSRTFKKVYAQSPSEFRKINAGNFSKIGKVDSKNGKTNYITSEYLRNINQLQKWLAMNGKITVAETPKLNLVYLTQIGEKGIEETFQRIVKWALPKGLLNNADTTICRVFHDSFKITDADKVRMSIGIASQQTLPIDDQVSSSSIEKHKCIIGSYEITTNEFEQAWNSLFIWMSEHGYKKANANPFEIYRNNPEQHPERKCIVDFYIPVQ